MDPSHRGKERTGAIKLRLADGSDCWAHSPEGGGEPHYLSDHLSSVASRAASFAEPFGGREIARLIGMAHDLGKIHQLFQDRLRNPRIRAPHAIYGAFLIREQYGETFASSLAALVVLSHHIGLPNWTTSPEGRASPTGSFLERWASNEETRRSVLEEVRRALPPDFWAGLSLDLPGYLTSPELSNMSRFRAGEMFARMLFSALVDADILDAAANAVGRERTDPYDDIPELSSRLDNRLDEFVSSLGTAKSKSTVNRVRAEVLACCRQRALDEPGFFSLTVPTGGGKTLSGLSFALRHATHHGLRRVISVIPYTSILEQNAAVCRDYLEAKNVIEHHGSLEVDSPQGVPNSDEIRRRHELSMENWDAPVIVTTNVQFFESLFHNKGSKCRKLHNVARSVILIDEAQLFPVGLLLPMLDGLKQLVAHYGCTVVLTTATQPAFDCMPRRNQGLQDVKEIIPNPSGLATRLQRFSVEWRCTKEATWEALAAELADRSSALAIVHSRRDARDLFQLLRARCEDPESVYHLSAAMYPRHRKGVLAAIKARLEDGKKCLVVSTQLVEAGVDLDFPFVYRALAGLDSLIQAAGRCNREGGEKLGHFIIFKAPSSPPPGVLRQGLKATESMLGDGNPSLDLSSLEKTRLYFEKLLMTVSQDGTGPKIQQERAARSFASVASSFQYIDDSWSQGVIVPIGEGLKRLEHLLRNPKSQKARRQLQPFCVNVSRCDVEKLSKAQGLVDTDIAFALSKDAVRLYYDKDMGLQVDG